MARLQILELPEGTGDERPPFALVVDQVTSDRVVTGRVGTTPESSSWDRMAERIGARGVLVFADTVEIPANDLPLDEPFELVGDVERMDRITDALGIDRLRDWDDIVSAARHVTEGGHRFRVPGYLDPQRCAECGLDRHAWMFGSDRRTCNEVQAKEAG
jgi:hypothetical protein